jgi:hypothetical protein
LPATNVDQFWPKLMSTPPFTEHGSSERGVQGPRREFDDRMARLPVREMLHFGCGGAGLGSCVEAFGITQGDQPASGATAVPMWNSSHSFVRGSWERKALCAQGCTAICSTVYGPSMDVAVARTMEDAVVHAPRVRCLHMNEKKPFHNP